MTVNASGATLAEAKADLRAKVDQHLRGGPVRISAAVTLATYLAWWVDEELAQRVADGVNTETTRKQYADRVRFQIAPLLGGVRLRDLSAMHLRQWQARSGSRAPPPSLRRRSLAILKTALERAVRYELIPVNPAKLVDAPKVQRRRREEISLATARALLRAAEGDDLEAAYLLALHVPMRVGEVIAAEWDCFDLARGLFEIRQNLVRVDGRWELHDGKTHTARRVPSLGEWWPLYTASTPARPPSASPPARPGRRPWCLTWPAASGAGPTSCSPARQASRISSRASTSSSRRCASEPTSRPGHPRPPPRREHPPAGLRRRPRRHLARHLA